MYQGEELKMQHILEATCHALLNLSTREENQILISKAGLVDLINLARSEGPSNSRLQFFIAGTLSNLAKHYMNRTDFYKVELHAKVRLYY